MQSPVVILLVHLDIEKMQEIAKPVQQFCTKMTQTIKPSYQQFLHLVSLNISSYSYTTNFFNAQTFSWSYSNCNIHWFYTKPPKLAKHKTKRNNKQGRVASFTY